MGAKAALLLVLVAVVGAGAYVVLRDDEGPPPRTDLVVVGDGLLFPEPGDEELLVEAFSEAGYQAGIAGFDDVTLPSARENVWPGLEGVETSRVLVIALGTNDSRTVNGERQVPLRDSRDALSWWLFQARSIPCVVLVGINEGAAAWGLDETGPAFNKMLEEQARDHRNVHVVDWDPTGQEVPAIERIYIGPESRALYRDTIVEGVAEVC